MIVAGTGHRPDKLVVPGHAAYSDDQLECLTRFAERILIEEEPRRVISGMAQGWDMALAHAATNLRIPWTAAVPFAGQERRWPKETQAHYRALLALADKIVMVSPGGYSPYKMQVRNEYMVRHAWRVLALWDGSAGGTANCVEFAGSIERDVRNVWPDWQAFLQERA